MHSWDIAADIREWTAVNSGWRREICVEFTESKDEVASRGDIDPSTPQSLEAFLITLQKLYEEPSGYTKEAAGLFVVCRMKALFVLSLYPYELAVTRARPVICRQRYADRVVLNSLPTAWKYLSPCSLPYSLIVYLTSV